jgi:hypothetical protein
VARKQGEYDLQKAVCTYLKLQYKGVLFNGSQGGQYLKYHSQRNKKRATGYKKGFPDLFIYEPRTIEGILYHGLALELKVKGNNATTNQKEVLQILNDKGYKALVCTDLDDTLHAINEYLQ